eukprot:6170977-Amphidinium_carterae.1
MYMTNEVPPNHPPGLNLRNEREMRTLALVLDHIIRAQPLQAADVGNAEHPGPTRLGSLPKAWSCFLRLLSPPHPSSNDEQP